jgi:hypothetical protein
LVGLLCGCQKPIAYADPILAEPDQPISPFVQEAHTWICAPSITTGCTQQVFTWVVPNVTSGDSLKIAFWWFTGQALSPSQIPIVADSANSVYTLALEQPNFSATQYGFIFSTPQVNSNNGNVKVTVTLPFSTQNNVDLDALEYSAGANPDGAAGAGTYNWLPIQTGPITVSSDADVLLSLYFGTVNPISVCPTCNVRYASTRSSVIVQDYLPPASGSYEASFSAPNPTGVWTVTAASFQ